MSVWAWQYDSLFVTGNLNHNSRCIYKYRHDTPIYESTTEEILFSSIMIPLVATWKWTISIKIQKHVRLVFIIEENRIIWECGEVGESQRIVTPFLNR